MQPHDTLNSEQPIPVNVDDPPNCPHCKTRHALYFWPNPSNAPSLYCTICLNQAKDRLAVALGLTQR